MKRLKKFFEFFDTEDLKQEFEIPYLSREFNPKSVMTNYKLNDTFNELINKLAFKFPFFVRLITNRDKHIFCCQYPEGDYHFKFSSPDGELTLSFRLLPNDKFEMYIIHFSKNSQIDDVAHTYYHKNININKVYDYIQTLVVPALDKYGIGEFVDLYEKGEYDNRQN